MLATFSDTLRTAADLLQAGFAVVVVDDTGAEGVAQEGGARLFLACRRTRDAGGGEHRDSSRARDHLLFGDVGAGDAAGADACRSLSR